MKKDNRQVITIFMLRAKDVLQEKLQKDTRL